MQVIGIELEFSTLHVFLKHKVGQTLTPDIQIVEILGETVGDGANLLQIDPRLFVVHCVLPMVPSGEAQSTRELEGGSSIPLQFCGQFLV